MFVRRVALSVVFLSSLLVLSGCLDREADPVAPDDVPPADTTAPVVVSVRPAPEVTGVPWDEPLLVVFSEAIDPASLAGQVHLSSGGGITTRWIDARTLRIDHDGWSEGQRVDLSIGDAVADRAGNPLARPHASGFWTTTSSVVVLQTVPAHGAVDVERNAAVRLRFSHRVDPTSVEDAIGVTVGPGEAAPDFSVTDDGDQWFTVAFDRALPSERLVTVTVASTVRGPEPVPNGGPRIFAFTTGGGRDDAPPDVVEAIPSTDGTIDPMTNGVTLRFDEPIDPAGRTAIAKSAQLAVLMQDYGIVPLWSADGTQVTLPLPTPLPGGLPLVLEFDRLVDRAGNARAEPVRIDLRVVGPPVEWPLHAGTTRVLGTTVHEGGAIGGSIDERRVWQRTELRPDGRHRLARYADREHRALIGYEDLRPVAGGIVRTALAEHLDGEMVELEAGVAVDLLHLPLRRGASTSTVRGGDGTDVDVRVDVLGREDLPSRLGRDLGGSRPPQLARGVDADASAWIDCWKVEITTRTSRDGTALSTRVETVHLAPGIGPVRRTCSLEIAGEGGVRTRRTVEDVLEIDVAW